MTSANQTSLILLSLDKVLVDNADRLRPGDGEALILASFKTIVGAPAPAKRTDNNNNREKRNAEFVRDRRRPSRA
jgi:hypothetical protein